MGMAKERALRGLLRPPSTIGRLRGNERGEDGRAPVRGFGIRPAWDCGDAYEYDRTNSRSPYERVWNNDKPIFNLKGLTIISFNTEADTDNGRINTEANIAALNTTIPRF